VTLRKWQMLETAFALRPVLFRALDAPTSGALLCSCSIHHRHDAGDAAQSDLRDFCNRSISPPKQAPAPAPAKWQGVIAESSEIAGADFCPASPPEKGRGGKKRLFLALCCFRGLLPSGPGSERSLGLRLMLAAVGHSNCGLV
jgi:hypothetical protein